MRNLIDFFMKYNYWFLFILLEVISFVLLFRFNNYQGSVFFTSSNALAGSVYRMAHNVTGYFHLKEINEKLAQENVELKIQMEHLSKELQTLTVDDARLDVLKKEALAGFEIRKAKVISNSLNYNDNYLTLDKGAEDGIRPEMGVIDGNSLVGIVYLVSDHYSVVIPVLNSKSSISCKVKNSEYFGFLKWDGRSSQYATIEDMPRHSLFTLGDTIVTSGHSAVFPSGIPIGTVEDMKDSHDGLSYLLKVKLFTDFARLNDVRVIERKGREEQREIEKQARGRK